MGEADLGPLEVIESEVVVEKRVTQTPEGLVVGSEHRHAQILVALFCGR